MNPTWRYFDYDYDNNCIIMTDESNETMGWVSSGKQEPFDVDNTEQKEPAKYPLNTVHDRSVINSITTSAQSNISNQSRQSHQSHGSHTSNHSEITVDSPPPMMAHVHPANPNHHKAMVYRSNTKSTQHIKVNVYNKMNNHRHIASPSGYVTGSGSGSGSRHKCKEQQVLTLNTSIPGVSAGLSDHGLLKRKQHQIHSAEYNQFLYHYHYHYYKGLMEFQRIAATKQF